MGKAALCRLLRSQTQQHHLAGGNRGQGPGQGCAEGAPGRRKLLPNQQALALDAELQQGFDHYEQGPGCGHQANGITFCHRLHPGGHHADRYWIHRPLQGLGRVGKQPAQPKDHQQGWAKVLLAQLKLPNAVPERRSPKLPTGV